MKKKTLIIEKETLQSKIATIRELWRLSFQKKYEAVESLIAIQNEWNLYEEEVEMSWGDWVNSTFGAGMSRRVMNIFRALEVQKRLYNGTDPRRYLPPEVLVYMSNTSVVPEDRYKEVMDVVINARPADYQTGRKVINKHLGRKAPGGLHEKEREVWLAYTRRLYQILELNNLKKPVPPPKIKLFIAE